MVKKGIIFSKALWALWKNKPFVLSLDITSRCNLKCPMCYWHADRQDKELTDNDWINLVKEKVKNGIVQCTYVGGEPLMRKELIEKLVKIVPYNWVVTNGTLPIPEMENTHFIVSLDGTEEAHDKIRRKGLYRQVKEQIQNRNNVITNTTIFKLNKDEPAKLLEEWSKTRIKGMTFNFATKMNGTDNNFYLNDRERNKTIDEMIKLKRKYKDFMLVSEKWLENLRPEKVKAWYKNCPTRSFSLSIASDGSVKKPCILGKNAICSSCGCHVPVIIQNIKRLDIDTFKILSKML